VAFSARDLGRALLLVIQLVLVTLVPVGLGLWVGLQLDQAAGTRPVLTIAVAGLALICALLGVYLVSVRAGRRAGGGS
jgi:F0F1-type ATP synthase assembly protein I